MKRSVKILIPCLLAAVFLAGGVGLMLHCIRTQAAYRAEIAAAEAALEDVNFASAEEAERTARELQAENEALQMELAVLETENAAAAEEIAGLQREYDAACADEDTAYYLAVMESLTEGMVLVENEINNGQ